MGDIDLGARSVNLDPDGFTRRVLARGPIQWSEVHRGWMLLGYDAATEGFRDQKLSADRTGAFRRQVQRHGPGMQPTADLLAGWMIFRDPPTHTHLREPVRRAFTPKVVERMRDVIDATVTELLDDLVGAGPVDIKDRLGRPLPALIIADLLGVPRSERERFQSWSDSLEQIVFAVDAGEVDAAAVEAATDEFIGFFGELIEHRRRHPGDDLVSTVVHADAAETGALTTMELIGACTLLLFAGHETTTNLITSGVRVLLENRGEIARLVAGEVEATAADELLRVAGPAKSMVRKVAEPHDFLGSPFEVGQRVYLSILTANRDPAQFSDPDRVDLGRTPNSHLGFGWGMHLCLGANLARVETTVALRELFRRSPSLDFDGDPCPWSGNPVGRSLKELRVVV